LPLLLPVLFGDEDVQQVYWDECSDCRTLPTDLLCGFVEVVGVEECTIKDCARCFRHNVVTEPSAELALANWSVFCQKESLAMDIVEDTLSAAR
jgi:hypothetical protein